MALFRLTTSSSARACSGSEVDSAADASSVARNLVMANRSSLNPGIGSLEPWDLAGSGEDYHISFWRKGWTGCLAARRSSRHSVTVPARHQQIVGSTDDDGLASNTSHPWRLLPRRSFRRMGPCPYQGRI